jgi:hypothetical protein
MNEMAGCFWYCSRIISASDLYELALGMAYELGADVNRLSPI